VLALPDGERHATDLRHLFELLHVEQRTRRQGAGGLAEWLRAQRGTSSEAALQRLESDARAVRIETVHASKGLEYPIVLLPFAWSAHAKTRDNGEPLLVRDDRGAELYLGVLGAPGRGERRERLAAEQRREELRKLYVSLTRAKHRTIAWYGPIGRDGAKTSASALGRLLMRSAEAPGFDDEAMPDFAADPAGAWKEASARLDALVSRSSGAVSWRAEPPLAGSPAWTPPDRSSVALRLASWPPDRGDLLGPWMVASYSSLAPGSAAPDRDERARADTPLEPDEPERSGERSVVGIAPPALAAFPARPRLAHGGGKRYGTCVHEVLEQLDFTTARAKDGRSLPELIGTAARRAGLDRHEQLTAELAEHLPALLATPLDSTRDDDVVRGLPPGFGLAALSVADRLDELHFDLRLGGGVAWRRDPAAPAAGRVDPQAVYDAVLAAADPAPGHLEPWLDWLRARRAAGRDLIPPLAGILTGTIDLVLRTSSAGAARYFIVDYKTNRIGLSEPGHYAGAWLGWEMAHAAYYLQALVYTLALHRHLGQRLPGYRYDEHVGGYLYLFLRGMSGARTPRDPETGRCLGVLGGFWPEAVVTALDAALGRTEEGAA
jgi:exodeoxyribonuclease V beta subunit